MPAHVSINPQNPENMNFIERILYPASPGRTVKSPTAVSNNGPQDSPAVGWSLDEVLLRFGPDVYTIRDACNGIVISGATGAGKTSGPGRALAHAFLKKGFGGLVLCAKADEPKLWRQYARETGREDDFVFFGRDPRWRFNFLDYEARRPGAGAGLTENIVGIFYEIAKSSKRARNSVAGGESEFFDQALSSLVRNMVDICRLATGGVTLPDMAAALRTAPYSPEQFDDPTWRKSSKYWHFLQQAERRVHDNADSEEQNTFAEVHEFWNCEFATLDERTRSNIRITFSVLAELMLRGQLRQLFACETTLVPEHALAGKVIVVDLPIKEWAEVGSFAATTWKFLVQKAIERRSDNHDGCARPCFIWADECQYFMSPSDQQYQTTARSVRGCTVYLTQSYPNLLVAFGGDSNSKARVDSLLGNLNTKLYCANGDSETNRWASECIGKKLKNRRSWSKGTNTSMEGWSTNESTSNQEQLELEVEPRQFTVLRTGGPANKNTVDAILFQSGRRWSVNGLTWRPVSFSQRDVAHRSAIG